MFPAEVTMPAERKGWWWRSTTPAYYRKTACAQRAGSDSTALMHFPFRSVVYRDNGAASFIM